MAIQNAKNISTYKIKYFFWIFLFILLELLPISLQSEEKNDKFREKPLTNEGNENIASSAPLCITPDNRPGSCVSLALCSELRLVYDSSKLRQFFCGFVFDVPHVCCPNSNTGFTREIMKPTVGSTEPTAEPTEPPIRSVTQRPVYARPGNSPNNGGRPSFLPQDCGHSRYPKNRVVGGREADKGSWPWMAVVYKSAGGTKVQNCGGSLVTNQHIITAAHCVVERGTIKIEPIRRFSVRLGEHDLTSDDDGMSPVDVDVALITIHDKFDPVTYENDIAVLKLVQPVLFNDNISAICLPYDALRGANLTGRKSFIAGWGDMAYDGPSSAVLREASFEIQPPDICQRVFDVEDMIMSNAHICAGKLDGTKDSCHGDSGGPLMSVGQENRFYLVGIVSYGINCATPGLPGVYTRVTEFLDWLRPLLSS